jgi:hypothetical protein
LNNRLSGRTIGGVGVNVSMPAASSARMKWPTDSREQAALLAGRSFG